MRENDRRRVRDVTGLVVQHLVARIDHRAQGQVQRLAHADGDEDFVLRVVGSLERLLHVARELLAQLEQAQVGRVVRRAPFQREERGFADVPRRIEVRLPDAETDDVLHRADDVEEVPDAGPRNVADVPRDELTG